MRYNITYKNGETKTCELTESAFDKLISEHFDEIDMIVEDEDGLYTDDDINTEVEEATGYDFYGTKEMPDEDEGTFRIRYYGGPGNVEYLRKSRNNKFHWKDQTHFDYPEKPFETNDYKLALRLIDKFGGEIEKVDENLDEATEIESDMFDVEYDKKYVDGRRAYDFHDIYSVMSDIAPDVVYTDLIKEDDKTNLVYYPKSGSIDNEVLNHIKSKMKEKFGNDVEVRGASSENAPEQRKIYVTFVDKEDEDIDENIDVVGKDKDKEDKNSWFDKSGIAETDTNVEMSSSMPTIKEYIEYLYTHNKNYTKEQWNIIDDIKDAIDNNRELDDLENKMYILSHHNKNYNRAQYNLISELDDILKANDYKLNAIFDKTVQEDELDEGIKDNFKKAGKFARNAIAAGAIAGGLMGNPSVAKGQEIEQPVAVDQRIDGTIVDQYGNEFTQEQWEALERGEDPYSDGATQPFGLEEDTVKSGSQWTNKGEDGTHGKFKTKKEADAQRKAMFANGYVGEDIDMEKYHNASRNPTRGSSEYPDGNPDTNPKIDIIVNGEYVASTRWSKTAKSAKAKYLAKYPELSSEDVKARIVRENVLKEDVKDDVTVVFFVKEPNEYTDEEEITAVFPNDIWNKNGDVTVYAHMGQHSSGDLDYLLTLPEANPQEYSDLLQELKSRGYDNLKIISKDEVTKDDLIESEMPINDVDIDKKALSLEPSGKGWEMLDLTGIMNKIEKSESPLSDDNTNDDLDDAKMNDEDNKAEKADMDIKPTSDKKEIKESFIIR